MATGGIGSLTVFLGLDAAEFTSGLTKAQQQAYKFGEAIGTGIRNSVTGAVASFGALTAAGAGAFAFLAKQAESIGAYQDIADKIGDTADNVTKLKLAADLSGTSLDTVAAASVKLTAALSKSDDEAKGAAAGLAAIGLNAKVFKSLTPVDQIQAIATALDGYRDGAEKTAVAVALWGKSGADLLPIMHDLAEQGEQQVLLTKNQIETADSYSKTIARHRGELSSLAQIVAAESIPATAAFTGAISDAAMAVLGLDGQTKSLKDNTGIRDFAGNAAIFLAQVADLVVDITTRITVLGKGLGALGAAGAAVLRGEFGQVASIFREAAADRDRLLKGLSGPSLADRVRANLAAPMQEGDMSAVKPRINTAGLAVGGKSGGGDDTLKKQMDNDLKLIDNQIKQEQDLLSDRNKMLDLYNGENLVSFKGYYDGRRTALSSAVQEESRLYDQEIARLQQYQSQAAKATDREAAQGKINDLLEKKARLQRDAGISGIELAFQEAKAYRDLQRTMEGVNASILELTGNTAAAARIRFDMSNEDLRKRLSVQGDTAGLAQLDRLRSLTVAQADYNKAQSDSADIAARLQIQEDRINTARTLGAIGELSALEQVSAVRKQAVEQQEAEVLALEAIARASDNPKLVLQAEEARAALEKLRAESDLVAQKFDTIFQDSFSDAFTDFIMGTKTAKEAFASFADSVVQQITKIVAQQAASSLFGQGSSIFSGGIGSFFSSIFGGHKAVGGAVSPGKFYEVNENGPELYSQSGRTYLMTGSRGGSIAPNAGGTSLSQNVTIQVQGAIDSRTQGQIASKMYAATQRALVRGTA